MPDDWKELKELVLAEIKRLNECVIKLTEEHIQNRIDIAMLKVKAGLWGFVAGIIASIIASLVLRVILAK